MPHLPEMYVLKTMFERFAEHTGSTSPSAREERISSGQLAAAWGAPHREHPWAGHDLPHDDPAWTAEQVRAWLEEQQKPVQSQTLAHEQAPAQPAPKPVLQTACACSIAFVSGYNLATVVVRTRRSRRIIRVQTMHVNQAVLAIAASRGN
jgi:hypothetical protein